MCRIFLSCFSPSSYNKPIVKLVLKNYSENNDLKIPAAPLRLNLGHLEIYYHEVTNAAAQYVNKLKYQWYIW